MGLDEMGIWLFSASIITGIMLAFRWIDKSLEAK